MNVVQRPTLHSGKGYEITGITRSWFRFSFGR
jgi:hypothetical protein